MELEDLTKPAELEELTKQAESEEPEERKSKECLTMKALTTEVLSTEAEASRWVDHFDQHCTAPILERLVGMAQ